jgi:urea transport system ATP-binding protein
MNIVSTLQKNKIWPFHKMEEVQIDVSKDIILYIEGLTVSFDGFKALNDLSMYVNKGELRCVIGANGAGKTTFMDVITGKTPCDSGSAYFGQHINLLNKTESEVAQLGIGRKFQKPSVFEALSVFENLELAMKTNKNVLAALLAKLTQEQDDRINEVLNTIGLLEVSEHLAGSLSHGQKQWLEIGMLLMADPQVLLVDEPVAGMTAQETVKTAELLTSLAGDHTVIVVEHDMEFVRSIARQVTVLHRGTVLAEGTMDEIQANPDVIEVYLGEDMSMNGNN